MGAASAGLTLFRIVAPPKKLGSRGYGGGAMQGTASQLPTRRLSAFPAVQRLYLAAAPVIYYGAYVGRLVPKRCKAVP